MSDITLLILQRFIQYIHEYFPEVTNLNDVELLNSMPLYSKP